MSSPSGRPGSVASLFMTVRPMCRKVVHLPPATDSMPPRPSVTTVSRLAFAVSPGPPGSTRRPAKEYVIRSRDELLVADGERGLVQDLGDVLLGDRDVRRVALVLLVGGAEQQHVLPGEGEGDAVLVDRGGQRGLPRGGALQDQVRALGQPDGRRRVRVLHPAQVVDPRAGGVEHEPGVDAELGAVECGPAARRR